MAADDVDAVVEHKRVRVGRVHMADDGLVGFDDASGAHERAECREHRFQSFVRHNMTPCNLFASGQPGSDISRLTAVNVQKN
jgi:hypothetical protein